MSVKDAIRRQLDKTDRRKNKPFNEPTQVLTANNAVDRQALPQQWNTVGPQSAGPRPVVQPQQPQPTYGRPDGTLRPVAELARPPAKPVPQITPPTAQPIPSAAPAAPPAAPESAPLSPYGQPLTGQQPQSVLAELVTQNPGLVEQLQTAYLQQYGQVPGGMGTIASLINKIVNEGYPVEAVLQLIQQGYSVPEIMQEAAGIAAAQTQPQITAAEAAIEQIAQQLGIDIGIQNQYGQIYGQHLQNINDYVVGQLQQLGLDTQSAHNAAAQALQGVYGDANNNMEMFADYMQGVMTQDAAQFGNQGVEQYIDDLMQYFAPSGQALNQMGATNTGLLHQLGANQYGYMNALQGIEQVAHGAQQSELANQVLAAIANLQQDANIATAEQQSVITGLYGNQGNLMAQIMQQLEQQDFENQLAQTELGQGQQQIDLQAAALELEEQLGMGQLAVQQQLADIEQGRLTIEQALARLEEQLANSQIALTDANIQQIQATVDQITDPLQQQIAQAELNNLIATNANLLANVGLTGAQTGLVGAQTGQTLADTAQIGNESAEYTDTPLGRLENFFENDPTFAETGGAPEPVRQLFRTFLTQLERYASSIGDPNISGQAAYSLAVRVFNAIFRDQFGQTGTTIHINPTTLDPSFDIQTMNPQHPLYQFYNSNTNTLNFDMGVNFNTLLGIKDYGMLAFINALDQYFGNQ